MGTPFSTLGPFCADFKSKFLTFEICNVNYSFFLGKGGWVQGFLCDFKSKNLLFYWFNRFFMVSFRKPQFSLLFNFMLSNRWLVVQVEQLTKVLWVWASVSSGAGVGGRVEAGFGCVGVDGARVACPVCMFLVFRF